LDDDFYTMENSQAALSSHEQISTSEQEFNEESLGSTAYLAMAMHSGDSLAQSSDISNHDDDDSDGAEVGAEMNSEHKSRYQSMMALLRPRESSTTVPDYPSSDFVQLPDVECALGYVIDRRGQNMAYDRNCPDSLEDMLPVEIVKKVRDKITRKRARILSTTRQPALVTPHPLRRLNGESGSAAGGATGGEVGAAAAARPVPRNLNARDFMSTYC
jgi:hypothetical protein